MRSIQVKRKRVHNRVRVERRLLLQLHGSGVVRLDGRLRHLGRLERVPRARGQGQRSSAHLQMRGHQSVVQNRRFRMQKVKSLCKINYEIRG